MAQEDQGATEARPVALAVHTFCVTGGREKLSDDRQEMVWSVLDGILETNGGPDELLMGHGDCLGVDNAAKYWARERGVQAAAFEAPWALGRHAGPLRNRRMLSTIRPQILLAFPGGKGTASCIVSANTLGIPVYRPYGSHWPR